MEFKCILCNFNQFEIKNSTIRNDILKIYKIYKCLTCNHVQLYPNNYDIKEYYDNDFQDQEAKLVHNKGNNEYSEMLFNFHLQQIKIIEENIKIEKNMKIIDIGGGRCEFAKLFVKKYNTTVHVLEPSLSRSNKVYEENILKINKFLDDEFVSLNENTFDIVTAFHVLEHVIDPIQFLNNCYKLLKPNGLLYIEVPNQDDTRIELSDYYKNNIWYCQAHISYFTHKTIKYILDKLKISNYKIDTFERYDYENYMYWLNNNKPQTVCTYYKGIPLSEKENEWIINRKKNITSDSLSVIIRK